MDAAAATKIPATLPTTIGALKRGQWAALFSYSTALQRIRYVDEVRPGLVRVEWDTGPGTRAMVRCMPSGNTAQVSI